MSKVNLYHYFHLVPKYYTSAKRSFFPGGPEISLERFQSSLKGESGKLLVALQLLHRFGLFPKVKLGNSPVLQPEDGLILNDHGKTANQILVNLRIHKIKGIGGYLYDNCINPLLFVDVLHLIATKSTELNECVAEIRLHHLGRNEIASALNRGVIKESDIGPQASVFMEKKPGEKLRTLDLMGVIVLQPGKKIPSAEKQLSLF